MTRADTAGGGRSTRTVSGSISVLGIWAGEEQEAFQAVIDRFNATTRTPRSSTRRRATTCPPSSATAIEGGNPPDIAFVAQPGTIREFVDPGRGCSRSSSPRGREAELRPVGRRPGDVRRPALRRPLQGRQQVAGLVQHPGLRGRGRRAARDLRGPRDGGRHGQGVRRDPLRGAGADSVGPLTDLFENIYLRTAGRRDVRPARAPRDPVDRPHRGRGPRADAGRHRHQRQHRRGDARGAAAGQPAGGAAALRRPAEGGMHFEGDFVAHEHHPGDGRPSRRDFGVFTFPSVDGSAPAVVGAGDFAVMFKDSPVAQAFMSFLTTPEAAEIWARAGRFLTANKNLDPASTRTTSPGRSRPTWPRRRPSASTCRT